MRHRRLQDARSRLGVGVDRAQSGGPRIVTRRGVDTPVVLSCDAYRRSAGQEVSFKDYLASAPSFDGLDLERSKEPSRRVGPYRLSR